jgi:hypothetical protein
MWSAEWERFRRGEVYAIMVVFKLMGRNSSPVLLSQSKVQISVSRQFLKEYLNDKYRRAR